MNIRALLLNGSPLEHGHSMALAQIVLRDPPADRTTVNLYHENISPCLACMACANGDACPIPDAMPKLTSMLAEADLVLVASPLHFTSLTAPVIAFFSRLQPFWQAAKLGRTPILPQRKRAAALVVTGGGDYPNMFRPARSVAAAAFNSLGLEFVGMASARGTDSLPVEKNGRALAEAGILREAIKKALT